MNFLLKIFLKVITYEYQEFYKFKLFKKTNIKEKIPNDNYILFYFH